MSGRVEKFNLTEAIKKSSAILVVEPRSSNQSTVLISDKKRHQFTFIIKEVLLRDFDLNVGDEIKVLPENTGMWIKLEEYTQKTGARRIPFIPEYSPTHSFKESERRIIFIIKFEDYYELVAQDGLEAKKVILKSLEPSPDGIQPRGPHSGVKQKFLIQEGPKPKK